MTNVIKRKIALSTANFVLLFTLGVIILLPFVFMIVGALTPPREIFAQGLSLRLPAEVSLSNFQALWTNRGGIYWQFFANSLFVTAVSTGLVLVFTSMVGYGLAQYRFRGRNFLVMLLLCTMMVPGTILLLPLFRMMTAFNLMDTYAGVILPTMVPAFAIFFFRQFCVGLPNDFAESARIDGAGEARIFLQIYVPMMAPAFGAMGILTAMGVWNDFLWPLVVLRTTTMLTIAPGLMTSITPYQNSFDILFAGSVMSVVPIVIIFLFNQRAFIDGLTVGGVKG
ncbi:MAG: carbohydrate ABC transporter permease [Defluviitaleaceae bacterium]|nr:carbohydrate ABC transporter permease [Defluviitaleaceae bacterium]